MRLYEHEVVDHNQGNKVIATVWLDKSGTVQSDNSNFLQNLSGSDIDGATIDHGALFMKKFPKLFRGSYYSARKVKK